MKKNRQLTELELDGVFFDTYEPFVEAMGNDPIEMRKKLAGLKDPREKMELEQKINFQSHIQEKRNQVRKFQDEVRAYIKSIWT